MVLIKMPKLITSAHLKLAEPKVVNASRPTVSEHNSIQLFLSYVPVNSQTDNR